MVDLSKTIIAKSDQLNADDLLGGPITVTIQAVKEGNTDQPVAIFYEGCNGKPFYPCKSMRRVLVNVWGKNGADYVGKSMTLFRDAAVKFGGIMVGGIRISHMSGLEKDMPMALQVTKGSKKLYTVKPLKVATQVRQEEQPAPRRMTPGEFVDQKIQALNACETIEALEAETGAHAYKSALAKLENTSPDNHARLVQAAAQKAEALSFMEEAA
ncbi:hypothetical protein ACFFGF_04930 [Asaia lannensis]|uniref:Phage protein n=1 Tax=Asaia lannensis NBRC 102526 TaxID=1307926 RepID=A0ABT1CID7_9PROT|nr:hypothetical protein [Asaia lannensis]MCO6160643.1 hypothetical protein [Asaia lannensis NBRC 102526]GBR02120.1 hypothetical protein AA102526_2723 [Asaia lannensis NBRC 102526]